MLTVCLADDNDMRYFGDWRDTAYRAEFDAQTEGMTPQTEGMVPQTEGMTPQTEGMTPHEKRPLQKADLKSCSKKSGFRLSQLNFDSYIILENNKKHM